LICERIVLNNNGNVARFVNVFDSSSSVTKIWKKINRKNSIPVTNCKRYFINLDEAVNLLLFTGLMPKGRYAYRNLKRYSMRKVANKIYPGRKISIMKLRFGDRLKETLVALTEKTRVINKNIIQIVDCWGH
jgi:FlaA1/EpsC-like NDP-sugar epimerase